MILVDDVKAVPGTIAQVIHMTEDVGYPVDLIVHIDQHMDEAANGKKDLRGAQAMHVRELLCAPLFAKDAAVCFKAKPKSTVDYLTGKRRMVGRNS